MDVKNQSQTSEESPNQGLQVPKAAHSKNLLVTLLILFALLMGGLGGYFLGLSKSQEKQSQSTLLQPTNSPVLSPSPSKNVVKDKKRLLMEKEIEGGKVVAYRLSDDLSEDLNAGVFAVELEAGEYHPVIFSVSSPAYMEDGLFEKIEDELWVINGQTNKIEIYSYRAEKREGNVVQLSNLIYKNAIDLPKYQIGAVYSIKCSEGNCEVSTAHHQESGCRMDLNLATRQYSNIKCSRIGGEFTPEPL